MTTSPTTVEPAPSGTAFDSMAERYDVEFTNSAAGIALRTLVWARLDTLFPSGASVLELGCGTGEDALHLAARNVRVVATDASREMLAVARRKASAGRCEQNLEFRAS